MKALTLCFQTAPSLSLPSVHSGTCATVFIRSKSCFTQSSPSMIWKGEGSRCNILWNQKIQISWQIRRVRSWQQWNLIGETLIFPTVPILDVNPPPIPLKRPENGTQNCPLPSQKRKNPSSLPKPQSPLKREEKKHWFYSFLFVRVSYCHIQGI